MLPDRMLWKRIEDFNLDKEGVEFPFSRKLQRETGWDEQYIPQAIAEYKKFVYLACVAGHPVSPSKDVDEVWHLHLTYTRSYWDEFCPNVLGRPLHHEPSTGGTAEEAKFQDWYAKTLESYERIFDQPAPAWIWPRAQARGGEEANMEKNMSRWCGLLKAMAASYAALQRRKRNWSWASLFLVFLLGGCASNGAAPNPFEMRGPDFLGFYWIPAAVMLTVSYIWKRKNLYPEDDGGELEGASPYLLGRLASVGPEPMKAALAALGARRVLAISQNGTVFRVPGVPPPQDRFERTIWEAAGEDGKKWGLLWDAVRPEVESWDKHLEQRGLLVSEDMRRTALLGYVFTGSALFLGGAIKVFIGLERNRPVFFLMASMVILAIVILICLTMLAPRLSLRGVAYLERLQARARERTFGLGETAAMVLAIALLGDAFLPTELQAALRPETGGSGSSCGGSDCGGGGCGGGGCGGCGGGD